MEIHLVIFVICIYLTPRTDAQCPVPESFHGDYFSIELGSEINTIINGEGLQSEEVELDCKDVLIGDSNVAMGRFNAKILFQDKTSNVYVCHQIFSQTINVLQVKKSSYMSADQAHTLDEVCADIAPYADLYTLFRKTLQVVNCDQTFHGAFQFSYEMDAGGGGICNSSKSIITACQSAGSPYVDNQVFNMQFGKCPEVPESSDSRIRFQCMGSWQDNSKNIISAVADLNEDTYRNRFRCMLTRNTSEWEKGRFTMSRFADCSQLRSPLEGPIRLTLTTVYNPQEATCRQEVSGATKAHDAAMNSFTYECKDDTVFADGESSKSAACNCDFASAVGGWGPCRKANGPVFWKQPSVIYYETAPVTVECTADAHPPATYTWYLISNNQKEIITQLDDHFKIDDGILQIVDDEILNEDLEIFCVANNKFGSVRSTTASFILAYLNDFPKATRDPVMAEQYQAVVLECNPPNFGGYSRLNFAWYKDSILNFIRPDLNSHVYVSSNGRLYFSSTSQDDMGDYYCIVSGAESTTAAGKASMPIMLQVREALFSEFLPKVANGFPIVVPENPMVNEAVTLECVAFGTGVLSYRWQRLEGPLPENIEFLHFNRSLLIYNVALEDAGTYKCSVSDALNNMDSSQVVLEVNAQSKPHFTTFLMDTIAEPYSNVSLSAVAAGFPDVTYTWYKNAVLLVTEDLEEQDRIRYTIADNLLSITQLDPDRDAGMYQLQASNTHGTVLTSAQLWINEYEINNDTSSNTTPNSVDQCIPDECSCDECNVCKCLSNGLKACTRKACPQSVSDDSSLACAWLPVRNYTDNGDLLCDCKCATQNSGASVSANMLHMILMLISFFMANFCY